jgi:hypothetical protein
LQIRLPDVELKSTGGVPVKDFTELPKIIGHRTERLAAAGAFPLYPFIYFPFADPARPRERTECTPKLVGAGFTSLLMSTACCGQP